MSFIGMTYLHLTGALALTAVSSETPVSFPYVNIINTILVFVVLFLMMAARPGPYKYLLFALFCILFGQILSPVVQDLEARGQLREVIASVAGVFIAMTVVGFVDNQNFLGFGGYLLAALIGLIIARLALIVAKLGDPSASVSKMNTLLNWVGTVLFAVFVAYDTQILKHKQKSRQRNPDYVDASLGLFLDIINLFSLQSD
jgi:FtsH-binding integral membrane protein